MLTLYITVKYLVYMTIVKPRQKLSHIALDNEKEENEGE